MTPHLIRLLRYSLPFRTPLQLGTRTLHARTGLIVAFRSVSGQEGFGEIAPLPGYHAETLSEAEAQVIYLAEENGNKLLSPEILEKPGLYPSVAFGLSLAASDLRSRIEGAPLFAEFFSGLTALSVLSAPRVEICPLLRGSESEILEQVRSLSSKNPSTVKLKVGSPEFQKEIDLVWKVSEILRGTPLRLDANRSWNLEQAASFGKAVRSCPLDYLEEPLQPGEDLSRLSELCGIPLALDESLQGQSPEAFLASPRPKGLKALILKPASLGSVSRLLRWAQVARECGLKPVLSSAYESSVTARAAFLLAPHLAPSVPAGLDTYQALPSLLRSAVTDFGHSDLVSSFIREVREFPL